MVTEAQECIGYPNFSTLDLSEDQYKRSQDVAVQTVKALESLISYSEWQTAAELLEIVKEKSKCLMERYPRRTVIRNLVKRVLKIIREEYSSSLSSKEHREVQWSLQKLMVAEEQIDYKTTQSNLKPSILDSVRELLNEIERSSDNIVAQWPEHIASDMVIMTFGKSKTVDSLLKIAAQKRKIEVIVCESTPSNVGHDVARSLAEAGITTTLIHDDAILALMPRVHKVIVGAHTVFSSGSIKALVGTYIVALAAKEKAKEFIVCAPVYKISPAFVTSGKQKEFQNFMNPPQQILPFYDRLASKVEVVNPAFDFVPSKLITTIILNTGGIEPHHVNNIPSEIYHVDDYDMGYLK